MAVYVLVGGGWLGGWCWQRVVRRLREEGHEAYAATLTGLGERVHLASPRVDLDTHITDVVNLIEFEDLHDIVLLGHSYAYFGVKPKGFEPTPSAVQKLISLFWTVLACPVISVFCRSFVGSPRALCPVCTSAYQPGYSTVTQANSFRVAR